MDQKQRDDLLTKLVTGQKNIFKGLEDVKRGVYGDAVNKTLGLLDRQESDELKFNEFKEEMIRMRSDINKNDSFRKKITGITKVSGITGIGGVAGTATLFFKDLKEIILSIFN